MSEDRDSMIRDRIAPVLGRIPSGLFIVTAGDGRGRETAMLGSWVQQASFDPPMITVAVNRQRWINDWLAERPQLAVSILATSRPDLRSQLDAYRAEIADAVRRDSL